MHDSNFLTPVHMTQHVLRYCHTMNKYRLKNHNKSNKTNSNDYH